MMGRVSDERLEAQSAPERIWATVNGASTRLPDGARQLIGGWSEDKDRPRAIEYVRADLAGRQSPAGAEPVADLIREALRELDNVTALNDQDANCLGCAENLLRQALASPPPKAVTITDEMVERACSAHWPEPWPGDRSSGILETRRSDMRAAIAAALSSEAHNG